MLYLCTLHYTRDVSLCSVNIINATTNDTFTQSQLTGNFDIHRLIRRLICKIANMLTHISTYIHVAAQNWQHWQHWQHWHRVNSAVTLKSNNSNNTTYTAYTYMAYTTKTAMATKAKNENHNMPHMCLRFAAH